MSNAEKRIAEFLRQQGNLPGIDPEELSTVYTDPEAAPATLRASDLRTVLAEVERLLALPEAWTKAAAEQQSIAAGEVPELPRDLGLVARGRARQLEDCAAELTAALNTEVTS